MGLKGDSDLQLKSWMEVQYMCENEKLSFKCPKCDYYSYFHPKAGYVNCDNCGFFLNDRCTLDDINDALDSSDEKISYSAAQLLGQKLDDAKSLPLIIKALKDENTRLGVIFGIYMATNYYVIRCPFKDKIEQNLIKLLNDSDEHIRTYSALALGKFGTSKAIDPLYSKLNDNCEEVSYFSMISLGKLKAEIIFEPCISFLKDKDNNLFLPSIFALGDLGKKEAIEPLRNLLYENNTPKEDIIESLIKIGGKDILEDVHKMALEHDCHLQATVAKYLNRIGDCSSIPFLYCIILYSRENSDLYFAEESFLNACNAIEIINVKSKLSPSSSAF